MLASAVLWLGGIVGPKAARPVLIVVAVLLLIAILRVGKCAYDVRVIADHEAKQEAAFNAKARPADEAASSARATETLRIQRELQETSNALSRLPDAPLTDRQRVRACAVLVRQTGNPSPPGC